MAHKNAMPQHMVNYLISIGRLDSDGVSRKAKARQCNKCRALVIRGLDADRCAMPVSVDIDPLTARGELAVLLSGGHTFELTRHSGHYQIDLRTSWRIAAQAAGTIANADVVAIHRCDWSTPDAMVTSSNLTILTAVPTQGSGECPPY